MQLDPATDLPVGNPTVLVDGWCQQFSSHSIGDLRFGPDGMLYASAGEGASFNYADYGQTGNPCGDPANEGGALRAQDVRTTSDPLGYSGAVIRVDPDGGTPAIVAYGFRNPFRFAVRPGTSELWVGDVGWSVWEELDRIAAPDPASAGQLRLAVLRGRRASERLRRPEQAAVRDPVRPRRHGVGEAVLDLQPRRGGRPVPRGHRASVSGVAFASTSDDYPAAYQGGLFVSDYSRDCIWYLPRGSERAARRGAGEPRSPTAACTRSSSSPGPDGNLLYVDINDGSIVRITYQRPVAVASAAPTSGAAPLTVQLDGTASTGRELAYAWDLDGDGQFDDATGARPSATFAAGTYAVRLRVTDASGVSAVSSPLTITADAPPAPHVPSSAPSTAAPAPVIRARLVHRHRPVVARRDGSVVRVRTARATPRAPGASSSGPCAAVPRWAARASRCPRGAPSPSACVSRRRVAHRSRGTFAARDLDRGPRARRRPPDLAHRHGLHAACATTRGGRPEGRPPPCMTPSSGAHFTRRSNGLVRPRTLPFLSMARRVTR